MNRDTFFRVISALSVVFLVAFVSGAWFVFHRLTEQAENAIKTARTAQETAEAGEKTAETAKAIAAKAEEKIRKLDSDLKDKQKRIIEEFTADLAVVKTQIAKTDLAKQIEELKASQLKVGSKLVTVGGKNGRANWLKSPKLKSLPVGETFFEFDGKEADSSHDIVIPGDVKAVKGAWWCPRDQWANRNPNGSLGYLIVAPKVPNKVELRLSCLPDFFFGIEVFYLYE